MYYILLVVFSILGALSRYSLELLIHSQSFPLATLLINLLGCFLLAFVTRFLSWLPQLSTRVVSAIGTGFVGSFTTFSTFAFETFHLFQAGSYLLAFSYLMISSIGGFFACSLGYQTSKFLLILIREKRSLQDARDDAV
ncbi:MULTISPECIES: fluoride efflux transporter FluC [unclassified Sporolactobacillus]|uniref:fluoride efflux transporter FluC n=1 Tax=unclassified Sporolactobacillus TaxID=2628533 RepID=UPI002367798D|nr:CrcB family protein [Sporolactobacillus sp. CQH2019]MDD9150230.1 CrcB family protein [Sporolactobacillus sp. CQH2019]